MLGHKRLN
jgi:hypothetical protein